MYFQIKKVIEIETTGEDNADVYVQPSKTTLWDRIQLCQQKAWDLELTTHALHTAKCKWVKCYFSCLIESFPIGLNWGMHANCFLMLLSLVMSGCTCWECLDSTSNSGPGIWARFGEELAPVLTVLPRIQVSHPTAARLNCLKNAPDEWKDCFFFSIMP